MEHNKLAIVDDDDSTCEMVSSFFRQKGFYTTVFHSASELVNHIDKEGCPFAVILTDLVMPKISGIELVQVLKQRSIEAPIIVMTANRGSEKAIEAIEVGAYDFVIKPVHFPQLQVSVERAIHFSKLNSENRFLKMATSFGEGVIGISEVVGKSVGLMRAIDLARRVADSSASVYISGETGSGKEVIAKAIHHFGPRKDLPFVAINCSAIPESLLESELFGHAKGSFTGAVDKKVGLFEEAGEGTIFLDEIGDLSLPLQSKLLRVLQDRKIKRIGENQFRPVRARIVSATHKDLKQEIKEKRFREDLFFRLNVIPIHLPPLRERKEDIIPLAEFFLKKFCVINSKKISGFSPKVLEFMLKNPWKGNVRELENTVERAVVLCQGGVIETNDLILDEPQPGMESAVPSEPRPAFAEFSLAPAPAPAAAANMPQRIAIPNIDDLTNAYILYALEKNGGAKDKTARDLGIDRKTLYRRLTEVQKQGNPQGNEDLKRVFRFLDPSSAIPH